jgi:Snf7
MGCSVVVSLLLLTLPHIYTYMYICRVPLQMSLDDIQQLMDDTAEAKEYQDSVAAALSQQLDDADNEAVMSELAALEQQQLEDEVAALPVAPTAAAAAAAVTAGTLPEEPEELPEVPRTRVHVPAGSDAIDEQERQLEPALVAA